LISTGLVERDTDGATKGGGGGGSDTVTGRRSSTSEWTVEGGGGGAHGFQNDNGSGGGGRTASQNQLDSEAYALAEDNPLVRIYNDGSWANPGELTTVLLSLYVYLLLLLLLLLLLYLLLLAHCRLVPASCLEFRFTVRLTVRLTAAGTTRISDCSASTGSACWPASS
jgi:hypothetical protein